MKCPLCSLQMRDGDTHGTATPEGNLVCRVMVDCSNPKPLGIVSDTRRTA